MENLMTKTEINRLFYLEGKLKTLSRQKMLLEQELLDHIGKIGKEKIDNFNKLFDPINVIWTSENECMDDAYFSRFNN